MSKIEETKVFEGQVAGHGNINVLPNGTLLKLSTAAELDFYQLVEEKNIPLRKFMPKCYNFKPEYEQLKEKYIAKEDKELYINMENLLQPFQHPTVMDLKLGTRLYDDNASEEKKQRMIKNAASTTSLKTGLKICGLHITNKMDKSIIKFDKKYGRALKDNNLDHGVIRFLLNFTKDTYINSTNDTLEEEMDQEIFNQTPSSYTLGFIREILKSTLQLKEAILQSHVRIYGCSICLIYEMINVEKEEELYKENLIKNDPNNPYRYPFSFHIIDFAHATIVDPSEGEDESLMTGINRLQTLLENYIHKHEQ